MLSHSGLILDVWLGIAGLVASVLGVIAAIVCWAIPYERAAASVSTVNRKLRIRLRRMRRDAASAIQRAIAATGAVRTASRALLGAKVRLLLRLGAVLCAAAGLVAGIASAHPEPTKLKSPKEVEQLETLYKERGSSLRGPVPSISDEEMYRWLEWRVERGCQFDKPCM